MTKFGRVTDGLLPLVAALLVALFLLSATVAAQTPGLLPADAAEEPDEQPDVAPVSSTEETQEPPEEDAEVPVVRKAPPSAPSASEVEEASDPEMLDRADRDADNARQYCSNIADAAADARFVRQVRAIEDMEKEIDARIDALEAKRAEYEKWLTRREEFLRKADESVVAIFTQMRPDAAAEQMSAMAMEASAAILAKLKPRIASAILNEMDPAKAAMLTSTMVGLARETDEEQTPG